MSLDDTVQDLADRLATPVVVVDVDLKVAAYSIHDTDDRRARLAQLLAGSSTVLTASSVKRYGLQAQTRPVRIPAEADHAGCVVLPLRHEKRLLGYLYYVEDRPVDVPDGPAVVESVATEIGALLAVRLSDRRHHDEHAKALLTTLLSESEVDRAHAADILLREGVIEDVQHYSVLVLRAPAPLTRALPGLAVEAVLDFVARATTVKVLGAVVGAEGVVLFPRPVNRDRLGAALSAPALDRVTAGVGSVKKALGDAVESYHEGQIACRASILDTQRHGRRVFWEDLQIDRLLLQLPLNRLTVDDFPIGVQRLLTAPNGRELAATLECYLDNGGEVQRTARRLNVHRSTLYYRLDRIREVTGCDISDGTIRMDLQTGLRVARLAGLWV